MEQNAQGWSPHLCDSLRQATQAAVLQGAPSAIRPLTSTVALPLLFIALEKEEDNGKEEEVWRRGKWWARVSPVL